MSDSNGGGFIAGVILGSAVGFLLGVLFAPAKGEETQKLVIEKSVEAGKVAKKYADEIIEKVKDTVNERLKTEVIVDEEEIH
ncbi:MAG TPA: YtxH domain-containing protein [Caldisericia bacterium]|nr:YtxH domain-containing protein [Caldisericia bacterium]HPF48582.1 YtxH domain-containing protein [Caldisericia bacterium]HPI83758.1 YtxH domain-containing protein [Caldisericia bacterium]HPQ93037.1 YtxH domain-containing protein [Caldisericia bacterium]HRV75130.1 YtxH domain-containing protein [Caldisericia bacterium]